MPKIPTKNDIKERIEHLKLVVEDELPKMKDLFEEKADMVILHQDAFAGDYQIQEYLLLGMVIKYIGLSGKEIRIIGKNRDTIDKKDEHTQS